MDHVDPPIGPKKKHFLRLPNKSKFLVPLIQAALANNHGIRYQSIGEIMKPYTKDYTLTDSIVQEAWDIAKLHLFGLLDKDMRYERVIVD